jgi:CRISPR type III-B/RAMP module RAMP protein Cmr6
MLSKTKSALGGEGLPKCDSRSLFKDRFSDPLAKDSGVSTPRKNWFATLVKKRAETGIRNAWLPVNCEAIYARLMSRLMVNLAGGVMENANVHLDRYGLPIIPGSAAKGCARRMALQSLHDWIEAGTERPSPDDSCAPNCEGFETPSEMLAAIARVFGWKEDDWKNDEKSDFAWATGGSMELLNHAKSLNLAFDTFAGSVAFLAALPNRDPGLELDVVTPHHTKYHQGDKGYATAPDTEDPVPIFFPAVRAQGETDYFTFPIIPLRLAKEGDAAFSKRWLAHGLDLFGIGAKTSAGYGWFDSSEGLQVGVRARLADAASNEARRKLEAAEDARTKAEAEAARLKKKEEEDATEGMSEAEREDWKLGKLSDSQFDGKVRNFFKEPKRGGPTEAEKRAIIRALRSVRIGYWNDLKGKASKGGDLAKSEQAIRALNKQITGDKMP